MTSRSQRRFFQKCPTRIFSYLFKAKITKLDANKSNFTPGINLLGFSDEPKMILKGLCIEEAFFKYLYRARPTQRNDNFYYFSAISNFTYPNEMAYFAFYCDDCNKITTKLLKFYNVIQSFVPYMLVCETFGMQISSFVNNHNFMHYLFTK